MKTSRHFPWSPAEIASADALITASLVLTGEPALELLRQVEYARAQLAKVRRAALKANRARHPGQAALSCVDKILRITAP